MSVVILGGNECMVREYKELCREYQCKAKVYPKMSNAMKNIGTPDLLVLFTGTMSHKMLRSAMNEPLRPRICPSMRLSRLSSFFRSSSERRVCFSPPQQQDLVSSFKAIPPNFRIPHRGIYYTIPLGGICQWLFGKQV